MPLKRAAALALCLAAAGCLSSAVDYDRPEKTDVIPSERVVFQPQQQVWANVARGLKAGFVDVTAMRGSAQDGLLVFDFELDDPQNFADCGAVTMSYAGENQPTATRMPFLQPVTYPVYRTSVFGLQRIDSARRDDFHLTGTANMVIAPLDGRQTLASVKINYRLNYIQYVQEESSNHATAVPRSIEFSTHYAEDGSPTTCYSNGALEISLLDLAENGNARVLRPCLIKGIVGPGGTRVYYMPGHSAYERVTVNEEKGDLWFCSRDQAAAAGWIQASPH